MWDGARVFGSFRAQTKAATHQGTAPTYTTHPLNAEVLAVLDAEATTILAEIARLEAEVLADTRPACSDAASPRTVEFRRSNRLRRPVVALHVARPRRRRPDASDPPSARAGRRWPGRLLPPRLGPGSPREADGSRSFGRLEVRTDAILHRLTPPPFPSRPGGRRAGLADALVQHPQRTRRGPGLPRCGPRGPRDDAGRWRCDAAPFRRAVRHRHRRGVAFYPCPA